LQHFSCAHFYQSPKSAIKLYFQIVALNIRLPNRGACAPCWDTLDVDCSFMLQ